MDDLRLGRVLRAVRVRRRMRQRDVAAVAGVSDVTVSRIERGDLSGTPLGTLRRVAAALEVRVDLGARWRGAEADRLLGQRHGQLGDSVVRRLRLADWQLRPEVSFSIYGERGVVDLLAWHPARLALLVIELKTEIVDVGELLGTLDRKRRLAPRIVRDFGWDPGSVSACVLVADSRTNRRRVASHAGLLRAALPMDGRGLRRWLRDPAGPVGALAFWPDRDGATTRVRPAPVDRVWAGRRVVPAGDKRSGSAESSTSEPLAAGIAPQSQS